MCCHPRDATFGDGSADVENEMGDHVPRADVLGFPVLAKDTNASIIKDDNW